MPDRRDVADGGDLARAAADPSPGRCAPPSMPPRPPELGCQPSGSCGSRIGKPSVSASAFSAAGGVVGRRLAPSWARWAETSTSRPVRPARCRPAPAAPATRTCRGRPAATGISAGLGAGCGCVLTPSSIPAPNTPTRFWDNHRHDLKPPRPNAAKHPTATSPWNWCGSPRPAPWPQAAGSAAATRRAATAPPSTPCASWSTRCRCAASWSSARARRTTRRCSTTAKRSATATARTATSPSTPSTAPR